LYSFKAASITVQAYEFPNAWLLLRPGIFECLDAPAIQLCGIADNNRIHGFVISK
jgi:hypothetical protein